MAISKLIKLLPTIIFVLVLILISVFVLNYLQINMSDNTGFRVLNRTATIETMSNEQSCNNGRCKTCNGINCDKHKENKLVNKYFDNL